jgi:small subunit ribosomal protein S11
MATLFLNLCQFHSKILRVVNTTPKSQAVSKVRNLYQKSLGPWSASQEWNSKLPKSVLTSNPDQRLLETVSNSEVCLARDVFTKPWQHTPPVSSNYPSTKSPFVFDSKKKIPEVLRTPKKIKSSELKGGFATSRSELSKNPNLFCLISINRTKNNTHASISNLFGKSKTQWSITAGQLKLPGGRRKTRLSQRMVYKSCLEKTLSFGYRYAVIHCRGTRGSKVRIFRFFGDSLSILLIKDTTGAAHNGCRPPKVRRV